MAKNSFLKKIFYYAVLIASVVYLSNITGGIIEVVPDNVPIVGNIDEAIATLLVIKSMEEVKK